MDFRCGKGDRMSESHCHHDLDAFLVWNGVQVYSRVPDVFLVWNDAQVLPHGMGGFLE
jgi:hypothetical protein